MTETAPKPCPFCGGTDNEAMGADYGLVLVHAHSSIKDTDCPMRGMNIPTALWNRRTQQSAEPDWWLVPTGYGLQVVKSSGGYKPASPDAIPLFAASPGPSELVEEMEALVQELREKRDRNGTTGYAAGLHECADRFSALITRHKGKS